MSIVPSVRYVKTGGSMVAKPVSTRVSGAWKSVQALPAAPTGVVAGPASGQATVVWSPPDNTGQIPLTGYVVTASPGNATATVSTTQATITGLTNNTAYTFSIKAQNAIGLGAASIASAAVTPANVTASMRVLPATGNYAIGATVTVTIHENSLTTSTSAIESDITYPTDLLQYVSTTVNTSTFDAGFSPTAGSGTVNIPAGSVAQSYTGDQLVATVTFTVLAAGTATIAIQSSSAVYRESDVVNVLNSVAHANYTLG